MRLIWWNAEYCKICSLPSTSFLITILFDHYSDYNREQDVFHEMFGRSNFFDYFSLCMAF